MTISKKSRDLNDTLVFFERFYEAPHSRNVSWLGLNWFRIYVRLSSPPRLFNFKNVQAG